jgi:oxygen-independent coproporphyrinogen-3 oxidase
MKSRAAAFDEAYSSLRRLGLPETLPILHAAGVSISRSVLGGSHGVAIYPPIDSLMPINPGRLISTINCGSHVSLYIHIAFCETRCTFCHYAVDHYAGKGKNSQTEDRGVTRYLAALKEELIFWGKKLARSATAVSSIYIGGGTPLILEQERLEGIISIVQDEYDVLPGAEICVEGSPLTITAPEGEDKLRYLQERGVTRLSFGVQSFDDTVLKYAARGYKRDIPIRAASIANEIFENWNLDLIQGLFKGSPSETWENLKVITDIRPPHLTWYHARFADRPQGDWYRMESKHASFEDELATLLGRMLIWQEMAALGYHQSDGNRFVRDHQYTDSFKRVRTSTSSNLLGVGVASYSHIGTASRDEDCRGYVFRNDSNIRSYEDRVATGNVPIATGRIIDEEETLAMSYASGLRYGRIEDSDLRSIRTKKRELSVHFDRLEHALSDIGVLECHIGEAGKCGVRISELGRLFEDEVLSLFFSPSVKRTLQVRTKCAPVNELTRIAV